MKNDDEAVEEASSFVRTVSLGGAVPKFLVHTRLGLLGEFADDEDDNNTDNRNMKQTLWVPGSTTSTNTNTNLKIDHKREQVKARKRARRGTIKNRDVPPLRPQVVARLADKFPHLHFVANGGIDSMEHVQRIVQSENGVVGAMVGRTVINHPCSFAAADRLLWNSSDHNKSSRPTRGEVLSQFAKYCNTKEDRVASYGATPSQLENLRNRLIAVPFHLFMGEDGSDAFQRCLLKLRGKTHRMKASSILKGASSFVPLASMEKSVDDYVPWENVPKFEGGLKRGSALQRMVY